MDRTLVFGWYEQYKNGIYRYALSILRDAHLAEDVLQDTFVRALSEERLDPDKAQAWLYRVARNLCYDHFRRHERALLHTQTPASTEETYTYIEMIASLSQREQEIVTLKIVGGLTHREIGAVLGITAKAAQKRYERAIAALRAQEE